MFLMTAGIADVADNNVVFSCEVNACLLKHLGHNWGEVPQEDKELNNEALTCDARVISSWTTSQGKIWIITDAGHGGNISRGVTTILWPSEY